MTTRRAVAAQIFVTDRASVAMARDWVYACCVDGGVESDLSESVRLLTSEIVTNAVIHTSSRRLAVRVKVAPEAVEVAVDDADPRPPRPRRAAPADVNGRGLALVDALADAWGSQGSDGGKTVWFRVRRG
ncbi:MAG TPA: ATP-binding protein [Kineosporiaceae bacterium]